MKRLLILILTMAALLPEVEAQHLKVGEKLPTIDVDSSVGSDLKLVDREYTCIVFMHSESLPSVNAIREFTRLTKDVRRDLALVLITTEQDGFEQEVLNSFTSPDTIVAFDNNFRTFENFNVQHIPFAVVYQTKSRRVMWFGSLGQLGVEQLYSVIGKSNVKPNTNNNVIYKD